jgi:ureidoglycolate hydrolase
MEIHRVRVEPLTEESFRPFGQVVGRLSRPADYETPTGTQGWRFDFESGKTRITLSQATYKPFRFSRVERHFHVTQAHIPLSGSPAVVVMAPPTGAQALPRPEDFRAFLIDGTAGYVMHKGTWHSLDRYPLYPPVSSFVMLSDEETWQDLQLIYTGSGGGVLNTDVDYATEFGVTFEIVL